MKFYELSNEMGEYDVLLRSGSDFECDLNDMISGVVVTNCKEPFVFRCDNKEKYNWGDCLDNDKGWFIVSKKLRDILQEMNTDVQYFDLNILDENDKEIEESYYIANIIRVVDAICLDLSDYYETTLDDEVIQIVSKYAVYEKKTEDSDVFKLDKGHFVPVFVSEKFKRRIEKEGITGLIFTDIEVVDN